MKTVTLVLSGGLPSRRGFYAPLRAERLGQSLISGPIDPAKVAALKKQRQAQVDRVRHAMDRVVLEYHSVATDAPGAGQGILDAGVPPGLPELRSQVLLDVEVVEQGASKLESGLAQAYLDTAGKSVLAGVHADAATVKSGLLAYENDSIQASDRAASEAHIETLQAPLDAGAEATDRAIVEAEGSQIDVREPHERQNLMAVALGLGFLALAGFGLYSFFKTS